MDDRGWGKSMVDASGKFVLVVLRGDQVRVHHKKTKHEYRFMLTGDPLEVGACTFHPNPAGLVDPRDFADEAKAAAEWFVANKRDVSRRPAAETRAGAAHGWVNI